MYSVQTFLLALLLSIALAAVAYQAKALSRSGALAATLIGALTLGLGGIPPAILLLFFFFSSSALSRLGRRRKGSLRTISAKGGRRDFSQAIANGGLASLLAVGFGLDPGGAWLAAMAGALAAATADTWATEWGVLSKAAPRMITTGRLVSPGQSGAVTSRGLAAAVGGSGMMAITAALFDGRIATLLGVWLGGFLGSLVDSFLGASVQAVYRCQTCELLTEQTPRHDCGTRTERARGWAWINNDVVNFLATASGAAVAFFIFQALAS